MKILVVEDNPDIKDILDYILKDDGQEAVFCSDGSTLKDLATINPDVILMDDILTEARGSELCLGLKKDDRTKSIPVVLISARFNLEETARKCFADAWLEKPFNIDDLIAVIQRFAKHDAAPAAGS